MAGLAWNVAKMLREMLICSSRDLKARGCFPNRKRVTKLSYLWKCAVRGHQYKGPVCRI